MSFRADSADQRRFLNHRACLDLTYSASSAPEAQGRAVRIRELMHRELLLVVLTAMKPSLEQKSDHEMLKAEQPAELHGQHRGTAADVVLCFISRRLSAGSCRVGNVC